MSQSEQDSGSHEEDLSGLSLYRLRKLQIKKAADVLRIIAEPLLVEELKGNQAQDELQWQRWKRSIDALNKRVLSRIRSVPEDFRLSDQVMMRQVLTEALAGQTKVYQSPEAHAILTAIVNEAWQDVHGWRR